MDNTETILAICNRSLSKIGAKLITGTTITDPNQPNAVIMNNIYSQCLEELIEESPWSFCINTISPALLVLLQPLVDFGDGVITPYAVPSDFMSLYLVNVPCIIRFEVLKSPFVTSPTYAMLSNVSAGTTLMMKYVFFNNNPTTYTAKFIEALQCRLAYESCFKISEAAQYAAAMEANYAKALASAQAADSKNSSPDQPAQDQWINARLTGAGSVVGLPNLEIGFTANPYWPF